MNGDDILRMGYKPGRAVGMALAAAKSAAKAGLLDEDIKTSLSAVLNDPTAYTDDPIYGQIAKELTPTIETPLIAYGLDKSAPFQIWGEADIDPEAKQQLRRAVQLPVSVKGALMPDAHVGYGLPIGGVLATENSVIPYAVGVDIACRMRMTIFDASPIILEQKRDKFRKALEDNTIFGTGRSWDEPQQHTVLDDPAWREHPVVRQYRDVAWKQLGTSGSGNHFVEFGALTVEQAMDTQLGIVPAGKYLALLSHSGSRRLGQEIANYYTEIAMQRRAALPKEYLKLAWLDLDEDSGAEYWEAMNLAGRYASANHAVIHERIAKAVRFDVLGGIENHHNFAWKEQVDGKEAIVHRKGATPAGTGVLGVIPGSMSAPGFVVRGRGNADSLNSAAHGAGRRMSRSEALKKFEWTVVNKHLKAHGVDLLSAGLDEVPGAYKDIRSVMAAQSDLVEIMAEFQPKLVKMDGSKSRPED
ncbi:MAG: RtcB family protein [Anaerolineae bacterium]|nr:RtcB family protein [Anaerolineae bacterium]